MRFFLLALVFGAAVVAPALASLPVVEACQPYQYYCILTGQWGYSCGTQPVPCVMDFVEGVLRP